MCAVGLRVIDNLAHCIAEDAVQQLPSNYKCTTVMRKPRLPRCLRNQFKPMHCCSDASYHMVTSKENTYTACGLPRVIFECNLFKIHEVYIAWMPTHNDDTR